MNTNYFFKINIILVIISVHSWIALLVFISGFALSDQS